MLAIGGVGLWRPGVKLGVDFAGGTEMEVRFTGEGAVSDDPIRNVMQGLGIESDAVVRVGEGNEFLLKFKGERRIEGEALAGEAPSGEAPVGGGGEITADTDRIIRLQQAL